MSMELALRELGTRTCFPAQEAGSFTCGFLLSGELGDALATGYIAQWLERLTADQQVPGSNPGVPSKYSLWPGDTVKHFS